MAHSKFLSSHITSIPNLQDGARIVRHGYWLGGHNCNQWQHCFQTRTVAIWVLWVQYRCLNGHQNWDEQRSCWHSENHLHGAGHFGWHRRHLINLHEWNRLLCRLVELRPLRRLSCLPTLQAQTKARISQERRRSRNHSTKEVLQLYRLHPRLHTEPTPLWLLSQESENAGYRAGSRKNGLGNRYRLDCQVASIVHESLAVASIERVAEWAQRRYLVFVHWPRRYGKKWGQGWGRQGISLTGGKARNSAR